MFQWSMSVQGSLVESVRQQLELGALGSSLLYGDGHASGKILDFLAQLESVELQKTFLSKGSSLEVAPGQEGTIHV